MKAEILRRAETNSDDEEEGYPTSKRPRTVPFEDEDFDEVEESIGDVSVIGDGEASEESDEEDEVEVSTQFLRSFLVTGSNVNGIFRHLLRLKPPWS